MTSFTNERLAQVVLAKAGVETLSVDELSRILDRNVNMDEVASASVEVYLSPSHGKGSEELSRLWDECVVLAAARIHEMISSDEWNEVFSSKLSSGETQADLAFSSEMGPVFETDEEILRANDKRGEFRNWDRAAIGEFDAWFESAVVVALNDISVD